MHQYELHVHVQADGSFSPRELLLGVVQLLKLALQRVLVHLDEAALKAKYTVVFIKHNLAHMYW